MQPDSGRKFRHYVDKSFMLWGTRPVNKKYRNTVMSPTPSPQSVKVKILDRLYHLIQRAGKKSSKARRKYKLVFDQKSRQTRQFTTDNKIYFNNLPATKLRQDTTYIVEDPSAKLRPQKFGLNRLIRVTPHTMTIYIDRLHNIDAIGRVTLSQAARKINQDASRINCDNQPSPEHRGITKKLQAVETFKKERAKTVPENYGS